MNVIRKLVKPAGLAGLACLLLVAGIISYMAMNGKEAAVQPKPGQDAQNYQKAIKESNKYRGLRQNDKAIEPLRAYVTVAADSRNKAYAHVKIANIYETQKQYKEALAEYRQAERIRGKPDQGIAVGIARVSYALGDTETAVKYYRICIDLLEKAEKSIPNQRDIAMMKQAIAAIEAAP
ncbi:MAG TPA: tetratricopeptide repeat protein [Candidatus Saccharimonadales bacterium]|nr:tetratricopeptide repeat protein [Candidatus Saccharimonadales bacterium]